MLKVAHILLWASYGGSERSVFNLCKFSKKTEPFVLVLSEGEMINEFRKKGIQIFLTPAIDYQVLDQERAISILREADLINLHLLRYKIPRHQLLKKSGIPFVIT